LDERAGFEVTVFNGNLAIARSWAIMLARGVVQVRKTQT
jgi:hypothetical protein